MPQLKEEHSMGKQETGVRSVILLGGGKTVHMGKELTGRSTEQSTHAQKGKQVPTKSVSRTLFELKEKAQREPKYRFRSLYREINLQMLYDSFRMLKRKASPGVDKISYTDYEENLEHNLQDLLERLISQRYRSKLIRRKHIPKGKGKTRPLGIPAIEDKIVQMSARRLLEAIYEEDFLDCSMGYRPDRGARDASKRLRDQIFFGRIHWIVEADIKSFFDKVNHNWLVKMLETRINDSHFIRLIRKWLKAGILEEDGEVINPTTGTPQGGIISPMLANIYLHHVLDLWIEKIVRKQCRGNVVYQRYADDFVVGFEYGDEAESFFSLLPERLRKFDLEMALDKSGILRFSRCDAKESRPFTYLGFDFYWARTRRGKMTVKRRTSKDKFRNALKAIKSWIRKNRSRPLKVLGPELKRKLVGHDNYYGVIGNSKMLWQFRWEVQKIVFKWLNRRSQRRSYTWKGYNQMWITLDIPNPKIIERMNNSNQQCHFNYN